MCDQQSASDEDLSINLQRDDDSSGVVRDVNLVAKITDADQIDLAHVRWQLGLHEQAVRAQSHARVPIQDCLQEATSTAQGAPGTK